MRTVTETKCQEVLYTQQMQRDADWLIRRNVLFAAGFGLIPAPLLDVAAVAALELKMVDDMAKIYRFPFPGRLAAVKLLISAVGSIGPVFAAGHSRSLLKTVPLVGHLLSMTIFSTTNAVSVYAVGRLFQYHFESGGTLLTQRPREAKKIYQAEFENAEQVVSDIIATSNA